MATFSYSALDSEGKLVKGFLEGDSGRQVRQQLRSQRLKPVAVDPASAKANRTNTLHTYIQRWLQPRIGRSDLSMLTRQLATLVQAGIPAEEALSAVAKQSRKPGVQKLMLHLRARVVEGHSLAYALADFPHIFSEMYRAMVKAGEHAGFLGKVLQELADYTENRQYAQQKLKMAMAYPAVLTLVAIAVVAVLMVMVVPQLVELFARTDQTLPLLTRCLIAVSDFLVARWWLLLASVIALFTTIKIVLRNPRRRMLWHSFLLKVPCVAPLLTAMETARFAATLSILVSSGVPLLEGLRIAGAVLSNSRLREISMGIADRVQEGGSLSRALQQSDAFPPMMVQMVASGESSGELEQMLERSALNQERELAMTLEAIISLFTPLLILLMAAVVGAIVLAILLPIIEMNNLVV